MANPTSSISSSFSLYGQRAEIPETAAPLPAALAAISLVSTQVAAPAAPLGTSGAAIPSRPPHLLFAPLEEKSIFARVSTSTGTCTAVAHSADLHSEFQMLRKETASLRDPNLSQIGRGFTYASRNRYSNIQSTDRWLFRLNDPQGNLPFEDWKALVEAYEDIGECPYINASCMGSYQGDIITQGPLSTTTEQFWKMIWLAKTPVIVMLTPFFESTTRKCNEYFPETIGEESPCGYLSPLRVKLTQEIQHEVFVERILELRQDEEVRTITHVHCTDWNDQQAYSIDRLVRIVAYVYQATGGLPFTAHCSAGIGRTGVFYACYLSYAYWKQYGSVQINAYELVKFLRTFRPELIQKSSQYAIIFEFINTLNHAETTL